MFKSVYKRGKYVWVQDVRADFVCIHEGELVATAFSTAWEPWQVIMFFPTGDGASRFASMLTGESFDDPQAAMSRAEEILDGTSKDDVCYPLKHQAFRNTFLQC